MTRFRARGRVPLPTVAVSSFSFWCVPVTTKSSNEEEHCARATPVLSPGIARAALWVGRGTVSGGRVAPGRPVLKRGILKQVY